MAQDAIVKAPVLLPLYKPPNDQAHPPPKAQRPERGTYRRSKLQERLTKYAIVNACLIALNLLTGFGVPWSLYVLISWGMVRGVDAWRVFFQHQGYAYDRAFQKWEFQQKRQNGLNA